MVAPTAVAGLPCAVTPTATDGNRHRQGHHIAKLTEWVGEKSHTAVLTAGRALGIRSARSSDGRGDGGEVDPPPRLPVDETAVALVGGGAHREPRHPSRPSALASPRTGGHPSRWHAPVACRHLGGASRRTRSRHTDTADGRFGSATRVGTERTRRCSALGRSHRRGARAESGEPTPNAGSEEAGRVGAARRRVGVPPTARRRAVVELGGQPSSVSGSRYGSP